MTRIVSTLIHGSVVDDDTEMTLVELCHACSAHEDDVRVWVSEGVLHPNAEPGQPMRFRGASLRRARVAVRLTRDLEVNTPRRGAGARPARRDCRVAFKTRARRRSVTKAWVGPIRDRGVATPQAGRVGRLRARGTLPHLFEVLLGQPHVGFQHHLAQWCG